MDMKRAEGVGDHDEQFLQHSHPLLVPLFPTRVDPNITARTPTQRSLKKLRCSSKEEEDGFLSLGLPHPPEQTPSFDVRAVHVSRPVEISLQQLRTLEGEDEVFLSVGLTPARRCKRRRAPSSSQEQEGHDFHALTVDLSDPATALLALPTGSPRSPLPDLNLPHTHPPSPPSTSVINPIPIPHYLLSSIPSTSSSAHIKPGPCARYAKQSVPHNRSPPAVASHPVPDSVVVPPPFPWSTSRPATVHSFCYLQAHNIFEIFDEMQCKNCDRRFRVSFNLRERFLHLDQYIRREQANMRDRTPTQWMNPNLPACSFCRTNSARPLIARRKRHINWLFLLLGELLGCCTLHQLKYLCKHTNNHRTGAKDRLLYLTYIALYRQLLPGEP